jgi:polyphosphate kinase 2
MTPHDNEKKNRTRGATKRKGDVDEKRKRKDEKKGKAKVKDGKRGRISRKRYEEELRRLQIELCHLQDWVKREGARVVVVFEGRDAAGKGGIIKRITERVSPRVFRVVALSAPTEREKTQLYFQRYITHMPAAGEIILFDRSWYNRGGVERVMGFCSEEETRKFLTLAPLLERELVEDGIYLIKYFLDVGQDEQEKRFEARIEDPLKHWKLSPMDIEAWRRWWDYTAAYSDMIEATDSEWAPWYRVDANDQRQARLNCIAHLLSRIPYKKKRFTPPEAGKRRKRRPGTPASVRFEHEVPDTVADLLAGKIDEL